MPAVTNNSKVLLTGGSGFLGAWILKYLLEQGFNVRAAVRTQAKANYLKNLFIQYSNDSRLEFVLIEDITTPGAFDQAVKNVDAIIHTASPMPNPDPKADPRVTIAPAVDGTLEILKSAKKEPLIKRVVVTSSMAAVFEPKPAPYVYDEDHWNESAIKAVESEGNDAAPFTKYSASKTLSERAAWTFMEEERPSFDLVTILPGYIWGQIISEADPNNIKGSNSRLLSRLKKSFLDSLQTTDALFESQSVDIRDVAPQHIAALTIPEAGGQRFLSTAGNITVQHVLDILNSKPVNLALPQGYPEVLKDWKPQYVLSNEKAKKILSTTYRPLEDTVRTTVEHALAIGWTQ